MKRDVETQKATEASVLRLKSIAIILILLGRLADFLIASSIGLHNYLEQPNDVKLLAAFITFVALQTVAIALVSAICTYQNGHLQRVIWGILFLLGLFHFGVLLILTDLPLTSRIRFGVYCLIAPVMALWYWALWISSLVWKQEESLSKMQRPTQESSNPLETPLLPADVK